MKDPFLSLYEIMGEATKIEASFFIAKVISPLPNLKVNLNDLVLDKDDFSLSTIVSGTSGCFSSEIQPLNNNTFLNNQTYYIYKNLL